MPSANSSSSSISRPSSRINKELQYEGPTKYCYCQYIGSRVKAARWTSWTDKNPRRRFYGCQNHKVSDCGYFEWHDETMSERAREVINKLKVEKKILVQENCHLKAMRGVEIDEVLSEVARLRNRNLEKKKKLKKKVGIMYVVVVISWVLIIALLMIIVK